VSAPVEAAGEDDAGHSAAVPARAAATTLELFGTELSKARLGELLAEARRRAGRSAADAAAAVGIPVRWLVGYERGRRVVPADVQRALFEAYGVDPATLLRPRRDPTVDVVRRAVHIEGQVRWVRQSPAAAAAWSGSDQILQLFVELVRELRDEHRRRPVTLRHADREALARVLELPEAVVAGRIALLVGCDESEAATLWRLLRRTPFAGPAAVALVTAGALAISAAGAPPAGAQTSGGPPPPVVTDTVVDAPPPGVVPAPVAPPVVTDTVVDAPPPDLAPPVVTDTVVDAPPPDLAPPVVTDTVVDAPPPDLATVIAGSGLDESTRAELVALAELSDAGFTEELLAVLHVP
jgi:transcriptional regulator with XRE-family HTH domain